MSAPLTRWVVLQEYDVIDDDLDAAGNVTDEAVERWVTAALSAYVERCVNLTQTLGEPTLEMRLLAGHDPPRARLGHPEVVLVSANVAEVRSSSFKLAVRIRDGDGGADGWLDVSADVGLVEIPTGERRGLGREIRDEFIALQHDARHFN
jgi:acyl-CoA thioesterase FadM